MSYSITVAISEDDLSIDGWRALHADAHRLGRSPKRQAVALIRYAIKQRLDGKNVELSPPQLDRLLARDLEPTG